MHGCVMIVLVSKLVLHGMVRSLHRRIISLVGEWIDGHHVGVDGGMINRECSRLRVGVAKRMAGGRSSRCVGRGGHRGLNRSSTMVVKRVGQLRMEQRIVVRGGSCGREIVFGWRQQQTQGGGWWE
jgi:hypothetical protein